MAHLVGGVSSAARVLPPLDGEELVVVRSEGPWIWDRAGRRHVDTALGFGGTVLGHAPPEVVEAASAALRAGPLPAFIHAGEETAAAAIATHCGPLSQVLFVSTGSEAVHLACRAARIATGKSRIAKMAAGFDGWLDDVAFGAAGAAEAAFPGNARPETDRVSLLRFNDVTDAERLFAEQGDIAAILVEPMLANAGCLVPDAGYLEALQRLARQHGALLIMDEVLMGFRLQAGPSSQLWGLDPDLVMLGKAIGSGIAVAAVAGRPEIMRAFADGRGTRAGTYSGNPVACAAVTSTMALLDRADYPTLLARGDALRENIVASFAGAGIEVSTSGYGDVFSLWPSATPPRDYAEAQRMLRPDWSQALHLALRREGVLVMPSGYGRLYLSFAHDAEAMEMLERGFARAAIAMRDAAAA
ncbi:aminotransferase class III-fold pyridoxal phosphate-dependent enzyme [Roseococcus sp.]|uniref:aminotransferase class III-fold pyridoxal phosphate-dependent enzyme n=1 Tax=Roseococcus sp. TaxID=2109646 RepID=UPI003BABD7D0